MWWTNTNECDGFTVLKAGKKALPWPKSKRANDRAPWHVDGAHQRQGWCQVLVPLLSLSTVCREHPRKYLETPKIRTGKDQKQEQGMELPQVCPSAAFPRGGLWFAFVFSPLSSSRGFFQQSFSTRALGYPLTCSTPKLCALAPAGNEMEGEEPGAEKDCGQSEPGSSSKTSSGISPEHRHHLEQRDALTMSSIPKYTPRSQPKAAQPDPS